MRIFCILLAFTLHSVFASLLAQSKPPKLVIGIVVDQMRYDYLYRYFDLYTEGGFKWLMQNSFNFHNTNYNYVPTYTGPGHASIYTGTFPAINGIVGNNWYDRNKKNGIYCVSDANVQTIGSTSAEGQMSPKNLTSTTITDELAFFTNGKAHIYSICNKDRGAILPAGKLADGVFWFDKQFGRWISSSFYMESLPEWVINFNNQKLPDEYISKPWETLLPIESYAQSFPDNSPYEKPFKTEEQPVFPHNLKQIFKEEGYGLLPKTPFGNTLTVDFALKALKNVAFGKDSITDFLAISFSSTDYVGHQFGVRSIEVQDTYLRLDKDLKRLLDYIKTNFNMQNVVIFLTADHGAAENPAYLKNKGFDAGIIDVKAILSQIDTAMDAKIKNGNWILSYKNHQIYFNRQLISKKSRIKDIFNIAKHIIMQQKGIAQVYNVQKINRVNGNFLLERIKRGIYAPRCGDLVIALQPGWMDAQYVKKGGTTHGSGYSYDTHVPLLFYNGSGKQQNISKKVSITAIAPTLAKILHIATPSGSADEVLEAVLKQ